jgi:hypothetical protein
LLVYLCFPPKAQEESLLASFHNEDASKHSAAPKAARGPGAAPASRAAWTARGA